MAYFPQNFCVQLGAFLTCPGPYIGSKIRDYSRALCSPYLNPNKLLESLTSFGSKDDLSDTGEPQAVCPLPSEDVIPNLSLFRGGGPLSSGAPSQIFERCSS